MSIAAAENAGPGPCDLQDPLWVKMSAITGSITKKRKKSDAKPQSQINKCLNEKRRRTQENLYIDELAELISATDMSSGKTDKCQILQRTVDQIRHIRQQEGTNSHAVQQGEVSSSNPNILSNDQVGPILLEALDGFLFVVNTEGRVEYVTDNITDYIKYSKNDVLGKDIYNIIHHGDHNTFMPSLLPMSLGWTSDPPQSRNRTFNCRFLVKPPDDKEETMEEKQQRVSKYETMQISSSLLSNNSERLESGDVSSESSDVGPCVMCVASRIPLNEKPISSVIEQFTLKLDTSGKIIAVDTSWLSPPYSDYLKKGLLEKPIQDLCHPHDLSKVTAHLKDTLQVGEGMSQKYRLRVSSDKFLNITTKSKLFKASVLNGRNSDFIMATNSILGDNDLMPIEGGQLSNNKVCSGHSSNRCANNSNNNNNNVGGPLMSVGHLNGQVSGIGGRALPAATHTASTSNLVTFSTGEPCNNPLTSHFTGNMDFEFELFPSSTWEIDGGSGGGGGGAGSWVDNTNPSTRSDSRASGQPGSRPPSQPAATASPSPQGSSYASVNSAVGAHCSPLRAFSPNSVNAAHTFGNSFPFSPLQEAQAPPTLTGSTSTSASVVPVSNASPATTSKNNQRMDDVKPPPGCLLPGTNAMDTPPGVANNASVKHEPTENQNCVVSTESGRLRNLLTKGSSASDDSQDNPGSSGGNSSQDNQNKNKILKNLLNQQDDDDYHADITTKIKTCPPGMTKSSLEHSKSLLGNNMLLQLLNEKNDDEDEEARAGLKKRNELLQQLLKDQDEEKRQQDLRHRDEIRDDPLLRSLGFRNTSSSPSQSDHVGLNPGQKRPGDDLDMNVCAKRSMDASQVSSSGGNTSKLWEKNKMLASLLAKQPTQPSTIPPLPTSVISATPQDKLPRVIDRSKQQQQPPQHQQQQQQQPQPQQQQPQQTWTSSGMQSIGSNATTTTTSTRTPIQNQPRQIPRQAANIYLTQMLNQQRQMETEFTGNDYRQPTIDPNSWDNQSSDPDLSDILDQVIEFVPDEAMSANLLDVMEAQQNNVALNEKMAINAIQKSLMLCENVVSPTSSTISIPGTPPAYSTAMANTPVTTGHNYQPPPMYQQQPQQQQPRVRFNNQSAIRPNAGQFTQQQQLQLIHRTKLIQQQQQQQQQQLQLKQRLLQQQQQQQLLIPSNATATDQITTGIHNIDNLLNNTVAPNVSLQRSNLPDSQVSSNYGGSVQMPAGHRLAHSYAHQPTLPQNSVVNNFNGSQQVSAAARLSPHSPAGILSFSQPQPLSPRVAQQTNYNNPRMFNMNQVRPAQQQPVNQSQMQQQSQQQQGQPQQRSMPSPGTAAARQSPFSNETFPPPASPTTPQFPTASNPSNPTARYQLQRTTSTPSATTQLPGGVGSPRHYGGVSKEQPLLSPSHPLSGCPAATPSHNQHNANNTQHFTNHQHSSMLYHNTANVQNSQYCYDRTSVPLYSSGPGDPQDTRPPPSSNPASHQIGGNASNTGGMTSEFVRQELRAIVGARTQQQQRLPNNLPSTITSPVSQDDLDVLGLSFELPADYYGRCGPR